MLPEVGSTIVPPGLSFPSRSAASIIASPIRSLFEPPGFMYSSFASSVAGTSCEIRGSRTIGVFPTRSSTVGYSRAIGREAYASYPTALAFVRVCELVAADERQDGEQSDHRDDRRTPRTRSACPR